MKLENELKKQSAVKFALKSKGTRKTKAAIFRAFRANKITEQERDYLLKNNAKGTPSDRGKIISLLRELDANRLQTRQFRIKRLLSQSYVYLYVVCFVCYAIALFLEYAR